MKRINVGVTITVLSLAILASCSSNDKTDPLLQEAFAIHQEAMKLHKDVKAELEKGDLLEADRNKLESRLSGWNERIVEVPGFEHDHHHDHDHDHDHDHGPATKVTPEHMLAIQQESLDSIKSINQDLLRFLDL